jgi:uncharacterized protein YyaL (SSP411 family)
VRMHGYTDDEDYRDKAEQTLEVFAGKAEQYGIFGATYGIAAVHFSQPHTRVVVIGEGEEGDRLLAAARAGFSFSKAAIQLSSNEAIAQNLPPSLAATVPNAPGVGDKTGKAVVCSGMTCHPPVTSPEQLQQLLRVPREPAA